MYLKILLTTTLSVGFVLNTFCQDGFPFQLETDNHSSYYGLIASIDNHLSTKESTNIRFEDTYESASTNQFSLPTLDNNGNATSKTITYSTNQAIESMAAVKIIHADAGYACYNDLELTLGFTTYIMTDSELNLSLPKGRYYYKIKGDLACASTDGCQIDNTGIIDIDENGTLYLSWQVTDYQSCWMSLRSSGYYSKVID